ncbi:MAG: O-antigen ligase family protein [Ktedonobacteraceae bacterium]
MTMDSQERTTSDTTLAAQETADTASGAALSPEQSSTPPGKRAVGLSGFSRDFLVGLGMVLAMALYYVIGNPNIAYTGIIARVNPLVSLPFLLIFLVLCWYRLPLALALLPLTLPYYLHPKTVFDQYNFSLAEITLLVCVLVAGVQLILWQTTWRYWLSWRELWDRVGPFSIPIVVYVAVAALSILGAYDGHVALRGLREFVIEPLLYLLLLLYCFRSRKDLIRLFIAFLATACVIGLLALAQYLFFRSALGVDVDGLVRPASVYGSANDLGILFDYTLPFAMAFVIVDTGRIIGASRARWLRILALVYCLFAVLILFLLQSLGTWVAMAVAVLFLGALSLPNRRALLASAAVFVVCVAAVALVFHTKIIDFVFTHHVNASNISTTQKRLYLWQAAWHMFKDYPLLGVGLNNWSCHYSLNTVCYTPHLRHYWITLIPGTNFPTGVTEEPGLQPHNDILNVVVSIGIFGLLAYFAAIAMFYWLFARITLHIGRVKDAGLLRWMVIGVGTAFLAALVQGQVDSAFLMQDDAYLFWALVAALLLLRVFSATPWRSSRQVTKT